MNILIWGLCKTTKKNFMDQELGKKEDQIFCWGVTKQ